ncbi:hypothetical protein K3179_07225 [Qipengyuania sp. GH38]|uniref:hypothetical protein n=1 Tax=Qipengyuania intermedia TaxID=2867244 RepID=UPI001C888FD8|nr:hypothetical protein [Qipengyuania intermedia]MBX7514342.1 hypothetical protein [Qipengyuania intermedia]
MSRRAKIICAILVLPYLYVAYLWWEILSSERGLLTGDVIFYTLALLVLTPLVMVLAGGTAFVSARRNTKASLAQHDYASAAKSGGCAYYGLRALISGGLLLAGMVWWVLDTPEPGRDRLGRICEESPNGSSVRCRTDPERKKSALEQANEKRRQEWWR